MMRFMGGINSVGNIRSEINDDISSQQEADKLVYNLFHINKDHVSICALNQIGNW